MMQIFIKFALLLAALAGLAGCAEPKWAPEAEVQQAIYRHSGPPSITVLTVISNDDGRGGHSALLINGSQRLLFDPAGTWQHPQVPERNDVHFGMQDPIVQFYKDYHARVTWHVVSQEIQVSPEVAEKAIALVKNYGAVPKAQCTQANTAILRQLPGFEGAPRTFFPQRLMKYIDTLPGVKRDKFYDDSPNNNATILAPTVVLPGTLNRP
jgi:hypothetical protein